MKIKYWDNLFLMLKRGYPVAIKVPSDNSFDWLTTEKEDEKFILNESKCEEDNTEWGTLTVPNPNKYINIGLYFNGHLDSDAVYRANLCS